MIKLKEQARTDNALREDVAHMKITMSSKLEREDVEEIVNSKSDKQDATKLFQQGMRRCGGALTFWYRWWWCGGAGETGERRLFTKEENKRNHVLCCAGSRRK